MKTIKYSLILFVAVATFIACNNIKDKQQKSDLKDTAYEVFIERK